MFGLICGLVWFWLLFLFGFGFGSDSSLACVCGLVLFGYWFLFGLVCGLVWLWFWNAWLVERFWGVGRFWLVRLVFCCIFLECFWKVLLNKPISLFFFWGGVVGWLAALLFWGGG